MSMIQPEPARFGRYQLVTLLAEGGMARLYLAFARGPAGFDKLVVVKQVRPELAWDRDFVTMFFDEARIAARLNHRNVVHTYEVVEENGAYLLVMEYLEGQTLAEVLRRVNRETMPLDLHLWILTQVLAGLHYAHELADYDGSALGVIHRDVSPSNVFITYSGDVKLLDFGIAKAAGAISATHEGTIKGKLGYSAPEQFTAGPVDRRADIYAVGVTLWEALARRRRKLADTPAATYQARIAGMEPKVREICPDVPPALAEICDKATAPDPSARYETAAEFQHELEECLDRGSRPPGRRELAALLDEHFHAERLERRTRVQELLSSAITQSPPQYPVSPYASRSPPGSIYDLPASDVRFDSVAPPLQGGDFESARHRPLLIAGAVAVLLGIVVAAFWGARDIDPESTPAPAASSAVASVPSSVPDEPPKKPERATIQLFIQVRPANATLTLDGARLGTNPFQAEMPSDKRPHMLHASAPGYVPIDQVITFGNDTHLEIALRPGRGSRTTEPGRAANENRRPTNENWRPTNEDWRPGPDPAAEPAPSESDVEVKRRAPAPPPRSIDEKDPYAP